MADLYYVVTAIYPEGETAPGAEFSINDDGDLFPYPLFEYKGHDISWPEAVGCTGYRLYRGTTTGVYTEYLYFAGSENNTHYELGTPNALDGDETYIAGSPPSTALIRNTTTIGPNTGEVNRVDDSNVWMIEDDIWAQGSLIMGGSQGPMLSATNTKATLGSIDGPVAPLTWITLEASTVRALLDLSVYGDTHVYSGLRVDQEAIFYGEVNALSSLSVNTASVQAGFELDVFGKSFLDGEVHIDAGLVVGDSYATVETPPTNGIISQGNITTDGGILVAGNNIFVYNSRDLDMTSTARGAAVSEGKSQIRHMELTGPPQRYAMRQRVSAGATPGVPYCFWQMDNSINFTDPVTSARHINVANEDNYWQTVAPKGDCYRWTDNAAADLDSPSATTETFLLGSTDMQRGTTIGSPTGVPYYSPWGTCNVLPQSTGSSWMVKQLHIPSGGVIREIRWRVNRNGGTGNLNLVLYKRSLADDPGAALAAVATTATTTTGNHTITLSMTHTVAADNVYFVSLQFGDSTQITYLDIGSGEIDIELDRHYPEWMA